MEPVHPRRGLGSLDFRLPIAAHRHGEAIAGLFAYRIDFENETDAAAPAQQVGITNQLNANLD